jgi:hypothetical protein
MSVRRYLLSLPERLFRSTVGLGAGVAREVGEVAIPDGVRQSRLYQNVVDTTLRFLIERVGGVEGAYQDGESPGSDFLVRRTAGNAIEAIGLVAFRASPVWVLAALADVSGLGRRLIPEIAAALKDQGLLDREVEFTSMDQMLDGLERTSARLAGTINTPPLDVAGLRREWEGIKADARGLAPARLPTPESLLRLWSDLRAEAARQQRSVYETSSILALSAVKSVPAGARWLGASTAAGAARAGRVLAASILDDYRKTLQELRAVGYTAYARRQIQPYLRAAASHLAPGTSTITERLIDRHTGSPR